MLDNILKFFDQHFIDTAPALEQFTEHDLQTASIALMIEMMHIDDVCTADERAATLKVVCERFSLTPIQAQELISEAETKRQQSTDYYQFTRLINRGCTPEQKVKLIEYLWTVAFADGQLDLHEEYLIRKIADLLYIPHSDFLKTKFKVNNTNP